MRTLPIALSISSTSSPLYSQVETGNSHNSPSCVRVEDNGTIITTMFSNSNTSLVLPTNNHNNVSNNDNQYPSPAYSCEHLLAPPSYYFHHKSEPNVHVYFNQQVDHRRLSDGPYPPSLRHPYPYQYYHHSGGFGGSETCMLRRKNSSLGILLDSTSSIMRTASTTFQCLLGSARRASYCGQPDPSVQLAPNGTSGSLYLRSTTANSNESSLSTASFEEQRRTVTIYDGRIPTTPVAPTIPFELMTPLEVITKTVHDPVESFVQIVLETPDDKPPILPPLVPTSPARTGLSVRRRHRSSSPKLKPINQRSKNILENSALPKLAQHHSTPIDETLNTLKIHYHAPDVVEPMDFSFLEPVLRGESAAPPPVPLRNHTQSLADNSIYTRRISSQASSTTEDSAIDIRTPSSSSYSSNRTTVIDDDDHKSSLESLSGDNHNYYKPPTPRFKAAPIMK